MRLYPSATTQHHSHYTVVSQPPADEEKALKDVSFSVPTTTYSAPLQIGENPYFICYIVYSWMNVTVLLVAGSKRFMGYSWSKPIRDPEPTKYVKSKRKKKIPLESRLPMLSPETDAISRSLNLPRDAAVKRTGLVSLSSSPPLSFFSSPDREL